MNKIEFWYGVLSTIGVEFVLLLIFIGFCAALAQGMRN